LIKTFIPNISLKKANELWIISKEEANKIKEDLIFDLIEDYDYKEADILDILSKMSLEDFIIDINKVSLNSSNISKLAENIWFKNAETDFIKSKQEFEEEIIEKWPQSLKDLVKWLKLVNKNSKFNNLDKFKQWNIIQFKKKSPEWEDIINYVKIVKVDEKTKELSFLTIWKW
jgi:hypothetical protein